MNHTLTRLHDCYARADEDLPPGEAALVAWQRYARTNRQTLLDVVATAASAHVALAADFSEVDPLLLKAISSTNPSLSEPILWGMDEDSLQAAVNAAKGKYFEYLVQARLEAGEQVGPIQLGAGEHAVLAESMTQPGWDLRIVDHSGNTVDYLQLKATESLGYIRQTLERYPEIKILATTDVASHPGVMDSGISDVSLEQQVREGISVAEETFTDSFLDYFNPLLPLAVVAGLEGYRLATGRSTGPAFQQALIGRGKRVLATRAAGGLAWALDAGLLSLPVAIAGGLFYDRVTNQQALSRAYARNARDLRALRQSQQQRLLHRRLHA